jgi:hypothetical protein
MIRAMLICLTALLGAAACAPMLSAQSAAPPGRSARLDEVHGFWGIKSYRIELSQGAALAVTCTDGGPCQKLHVTSENAEIAEVHDAALGLLQPNGYAGNQATAAALVVVGKAVGTTMLHLSTSSGGRTIKVTVIPQPDVNRATSARAPRS